MQHTRLSLPYVLIKLNYFNAFYSFGNSLYGNSNKKHFSKALKELRDKLAAEDLHKSNYSLDNFIGSTASVSKRMEALRLPEWLKTPIPTGKSFSALKDQLRSLKLNTVCEEAKCPNIGDCWSPSSDKSIPSTATIMLMGSECTRGCRFCSVKTNRAPAPLDPNEPEHTAEAISKWGVGYVVLTSVDRDDLEDFGANHFARTVVKLKEKSPEILVECLVGDFQGREELAFIVARSGLHVFAHNMETVRRLTPTVRDRRATYGNSLRILSRVKQELPEIITKSSLMLGLGETSTEIRETLQDLKEAGVDIVTFGQYMRPTKKHMKVVQYVRPEEFEEWKNIGMKEFGFKYVASGPLVRSSYRAGEVYIENILKDKLKKQ